MFASMVEGIFACEGCGQTYPEYVNGCVKCWDDEASISENLRRYPRRRVVLVVPTIGAQGEG
jgi:hypothetical protein